ncbi:probable uridine nucleosidase 2 [Lactuca sativa]|uniref:probable uridine nucleosidase 2 n=1 Tax=Lactuca sativa TaxID=4236 RepID=UPI000CD9405E|nr:probable uridine nucleosidase 2 [Lactuca sativa]
MAIFVALRSPEITVIGLTTIFGNVYTTLATRNALHLLEVAGRSDIPVAEGSHVSYMKSTKLQVRDFAHGMNGLGNQNFPQPKSKPIEKSASEYLVEQANLYPGEVTVVALGPLTNIALAIQLDPTFTKKIGQIVLLGGAFAIDGNVNPAAETNIFGDPEAADIVFTSGADVLAIGMNVTRQVIMKNNDLTNLAKSDGIFAKYLCKILDHYFSYHRDAYNIKGIYLHDPTALLATVNSSLMTYTEGVVRVQTTGITRGLTLFFNKRNRFNEATEWSNKRTVKVAVTVDAPAVVKLVTERLM